MQRIMIVDVSEIYAEAIARVFRAEFDVKVCCDGISAQELLPRFRPDVLIISFTLPYRDGLTVLQESDFRPSVIIGLSSLVNDYIIRRAESLGVCYLLQRPTANTVRVRVLDILKQRAEQPYTLDEETSFHLHILNFNTKLEGYRLLLAAIPLYARDPGQLLSKELYPAVAHLNGVKDPRAVERAIRQAICAAWRRHDRVVWSKYFPFGPNYKIPCPSNKVFISRLAEMIKET